MWGPHFFVLAAQRRVRRLRAKKCFARSVPQTALARKSRLGSPVPTGSWDRIAWGRLVEFPSRFPKTERSTKKKARRRAGRSWGLLVYEYGRQARARNGAPHRPTRLSLELEEVVAASALSFYRPPSHQTISCGSCSAWPGPPSVLPPASVPRARLLPLARFDMSGLMSTTGCEAFVDSLASDRIVPRKSAKTSS